MKQIPGLRKPKLACGRTQDHVDSVQSPSSRSPLRLCHSRIRIEMLQQ